MKRTLVILLALLAAASCWAMQLKSGQEYLLPKGSLVDDDLFAAGSKVIIEGTVKGDVFAFAGEVVVRGRIEGELFAFAGDVTIEDTVLGPARIFAGNVTVNGYVAGNISVFGGKVELRGTAGRDASIRSGQAQISGTIVRDLGLQAKQAVLSGTVGRDAFVRTQLLSFGPQASVLGALNYRSPSKLEIPAGLVASGRVMWQPLPKEKGSGIRQTLKRFAVFIGILSFLSTLLIGFIALAVFRKACQDIVDHVNGHFWPCLGVGILWLLGVPVAVAMLLVTLIGIPLAAFLAMLYMVVLYLASIIFGLLLGQRIFGLLKRPDISPYLAYLVGLIVLSVLFLVPVLGIMVKVFVLVLAGGAVVASRYDFLVQLRSGGRI